MANYVASARSNYFRVRDEAAFGAWVATLPGVAAHKENAEDGADRFVLLVEDGDCGGWPFQREVQLHEPEPHDDFLRRGRAELERAREAGKTEEEVRALASELQDERCRVLAGSVEEQEIDLAAELSGHLAEGEVAVLKEVGHERLRALVGEATAVNCRGEKLSVSLQDIYGKVKEAGWGSPTEAAY